MEGDSMKNNSITNAIQDLTEVIRNHSGNVDPGTGGGSTPEGGGGSADSSLKVTVTVDLAMDPDSPGGISVTGTCDTDYAVILEAMTNRRPIDFYGWMNAPEEIIPYQHNYCSILIACYIPEEESPDGEGIMVEMMTVDGEIPIMIKSDNTITVLF